jgi:hypothetical protein
VSFPANWDAPPKITLECLASWTSHPDAGVKYFSGTAVYTREFTAPAEWLRPGAKVLLDLGSVREIAEVSVNGKPLGIHWKPFLGYRPFEFTKDTLLLESGLLGPVRLSAVGRK